MNFLRITLLHMLLLSPLTPTLAGSNLSSSQIPDSASTICLAKPTNLNTENFTPRFQHAIAESGLETKSFNTSLPQASSGLHRAGSDGRAKFQTILGFGVANDFGEGGFLNIKLNVINGVRINRFSTGIGVGLRLFPENDALVFPVYLDMRLAPGPGRVSPMIGVKVGNAFQNSEGRKYDRLYFGGEAGIYVGGGQSTSIVISLEFESYTLLGDNEFFSNGFGFSFRSGAQQVSLLGLNFSIFF